MVFIHKLNYGKALEKVSFVKIFPTGLLVMWRCEGLFWELKLMTWGRFQVSSFFLFFLVDLFGRNIGKSTLLKVCERLPSLSSLAKMIYKSVWVLTSTQR